MQDYMMGRMKNSTNGAAVEPIPLFASSWVALYHYFRQNLERKRNCEGATGKNSKKNGNGTKH